MDKKTRKFGKWLANKDYIAEPWRPGRQCKSQKGVFVAQALSELKTVSVYIEE